MFSLLLITIFSFAQNNKGIHIQGIARNQNGMIIADKQISLRLSIINDTLTHGVVYQEIISVTTNALGLFLVDLGVEEDGKVITMGDFQNIEWNSGEYYFRVEVDENNSLSFTAIGIEKLNYVPLALYADRANRVNSIVPVEFGGTGVNNVKEFVKILNLDKVSNSPDSLKPISIINSIALNEKLKKADTITLSNRINLKLNSADTINLSHRVNTKLNTIDTINLSARINAKLNARDTLNLSNRINALPKIDTTYLSNRINNKISVGALSNGDIVNGLGFSPVKNYFGSFYDTSRQLTAINTATAVKIFFQHLANKINVVANSAGNPTRITVSEAGVYQLNYSLQFIKSDIGTDELNIWIRRNSSAYPNTNNLYTLLGNNVRNIITGMHYIELGSNDYVELFYSIKNINSVLAGTVATTVTPSRPATPSAIISIHAIN